MNKYLLFFLMTCSVFISPSFARDDFDSLNRGVDSLLEEISSIQKKIDEFGNPERLFASGSAESIGELGKELSSIEQKRREIIKGKAFAKLQGIEKEEIQNKLDGLQMQINTLLQDAQLFQSLISLVDNSNRERKQGIGISTIAQYIIFFGIVILVIFASLVIMWHQKHSSVLNKLEMLELSSHRLDVNHQSSQESSMLSQKILLKLENMESFIANSLIHEVNFVKSGLKNLEQIVQNLQTSTQQELKELDIEEAATQPKESPLQTFCHLYNAVMESSIELREFIHRYNPIRVTNVITRQHHIGTATILQTATDGDYYAVEIEGYTFHAVVPRLGLTFQESSYGAGAMGEVFDCPNYNSQLRYREVKVVKPAFFEADIAKQRWILVEKGELDLGQGEQR